MKNSNSDKNSSASVTREHPLIKPSEPSIDLLQLAFRNIGWLMLAGVAGVALGIGAYKYLGPKYVAQSQILVKLKNPVAIRDDSDRQVVGERSAHVEIIKSPKVIERAVRDGELGKLESLAGSEEPTQDIIEGLIISRTAGEDHHQLNILDLRYSNGDGEDGVLILNAIIKAYDDYLQDDARKNHMELTNLLEQINNDLAPRLRKMTADYQNFREEAPLIWKAPPGAKAGPNDVTNIHQRRVDAIAAERVKTELKYEEISSRVRTIEQALESGESREGLLLLVKTFLQKDQTSSTQTVVAGATERQQLDSQLIPLLLEEAALLKKFSSDHPDVINVRRRMDVVKQYYEKMGVEMPTVARKRNPVTGESETVYGNDPITTYMTALGQQKVELNNRLEELQKLYDSSTRQAKEFARYETQDQTFSDELERIKSLHDIVANRIEELSLQPDKGYHMQQISPSRAEKDMKHVIKTVGGCLILTLMFAYGLLFWREMRDTSLKSLGDVRSLSDRPVLGTLPAVTNASRNLESARQTGLDPMLYYYHNPGSAEAEACRSIRSTFFVKAGDHDARVVQFTSSEPGDGKTTTISNLAIAIAQAGKRVLLIDADLRKPMVHRLFGLREEIGLSECLQGEIEPANAIQSTPVENLSVLSAGNIPNKPAELLSSARLHYLFGEVRREYDFVLVDSPPVLAVTDPCISGQSVDAAMLVVRMYKNKRPAVKRALELFETHEIELLGLIANGQVMQTGEYDYRGNYGKAYEDPAPVYSGNPLAAVMEK